MNFKLIQKAYQFAEKYHRNQVRKYTGEAYITHPVSVAFMLAGTEHDCAESIATALLHDVVEDTSVTLQAIEHNFGYKVASGVEYLTERKDPGVTRKMRKEHEAVRLSSAPDWVQTIKLADCIHNLTGLEKHDPAFYKVYKEEKRLFAIMLNRGDLILQHDLLELTE